jgi:hypothetical protein
MRVHASECYFESPGCRDSLWTMFMYVYIVESLWRFYDRYHLWNFIPVTSLWQPFDTAFDVILCHRPHPCARPCYPLSPYCCLWLLSQTIYIYIFTYVTRLFCHRSLFEPLAISLRNVHRAQGSTCRVYRAVRDEPGFALFGLISPDPVFIGKTEIARGRTGMFRRQCAVRKQLRSHAVNKTNVACSSQVLYGKNLVLFR